MKSILKKIAGLALGAVLTLGMFSCTVDSPGRDTVATPVFSVAAGIVNDGTSVTITCATEGAKIYYTTDGTEPTAESTEYADAISVTPPLTIKAIAVKDGMNDSAVASVTYKVKPNYSECAVGDFILKDGSILSQTETPEADSVAAIIVRAAADGKPALGVGIVWTELKWCLTKSVGANIKIETLLGDKEYNSNYTDGSTGWAKLKAACNDAEANPENYPAWNFCLSYGTTQGFIGELETGWYLPTIAELNSIYEHKNTVNASLKKINAKTLAGYYFSSCQSDEKKDEAKMLFFTTDAIVKGYYKDNESQVRAVKVFN